MRDQPNRPGPTFRAHLTDDLRIVKSLIESRIVVESGFAHSTGGKRPVLLRLNDKDLYAIGVSLHIARYVVVVCGPDGAEVARTEIRVGAMYNAMANWSETVFPKSLRSSKLWPTASRR